VKELEWIILGLFFGFMILEVGFCMDTQGHEMGFDKLTHLSRGSLGFFFCLMILEGGLCMDTQGHEKLR